MFHIFFMNRGYMLMLEPPTLGSIFDLQKCIYSSTGVEIQDQIMYLSGGASLSGNTMLSTISGAGTDTNPIFLVKRVSTNVHVQSTTAKENADGIDELYQGWNAGIERLDRINSNSPSTITECVEMGKKGAATAETIVRFCANIIAEHQYLHQGWLAVIANLDDNLDRIQRHLDKSKVHAEKLEEIRDKGRQLLADFDSVIKMLAKIVIPPSLLSLKDSSKTTPHALTDSDEFGEEVTLFDWIDDKDPTFSLDSVSSHVLDRLERTDDSDLREGQVFYQMVREVAHKTQYRDINGIDKRLAMLNSKLQHLEGCLAHVREVSSRVVQPVVQDSTQNIAVWQKQKLTELKEPLRSLHEYAHCFINSKEELVKNISQRFSTWIRQAYQRLHEVNKRMVLFEEKFSDLRKQLDVARQIKEAPNIYMAAVPEVIRREELKKEFVGWIAAHIDRTSAFIGEENRIREEFQSKLDRHFLHQLFTGMGDKIPQFAPQSPPKIDQDLPKVSMVYLTELRKSFPEMRELLIIGAPQVFRRLSVADPNMLRREQSFYDREQSSNMAAMNRNFPSTNWLSDQNMEISPSMAHIFQGQPGFGSSASIHSNMDPQSPPQELGPLSDQPSPHPHFSLSGNSRNEPSPVEQSIKSHSQRASMSPLQPSAPIAIPTASTMHCQKDPIESIGSNHFSTPEEFSSFGSNRGEATTATSGPIRNIFPNQSMFRCSPKITRPLSLIRAQQSSQQQILLEEETVRISLSGEELKSNLTNTQNELKQLNQDMTDLREIGQRLAELGHDFPLDFSEVKQSIQMLIDTRLQEMTNEVKQEMERQKQEGLEKMKAEFCAQIGKLNSDLEHERQLRIRKEQEMISQESQICQLNEQLVLLMKSKDDLEALVKQRETAISSLQTENEAQNALPLAEVATQELAMAISTSVIEDPEESKNASSQQPAGSDEEEGIVQLSSRSCSSQTKIRARDIQAFVSLNEIYEGFGALIIWNAQMNAFMAHCSNPKPFPYIVKENCLERLGIRRSRNVGEANDSVAASSSMSAPPLPQRTWAFVMVETIEPCQIRKISNRYNLPLDSRFYRISVRPMPGEFGSSISSTTSIASSSRR